MADVEPEGDVGGEPFGVHCLEDRRECVDVVVDFEIVCRVLAGRDRRIARCLLERPQEGNEQRVECGRVETFAK